VRAGKLAGAAAGALANIEGIKAAGLEPVLFARWMGLQVQLSTATVQADRLGAARALAERYRATVVLKGSGSVIASPDGAAPWINGSGNAALATAGTGDVLAGWIGGWWSQGLGAAEAARLGVHSHGAAADRWRAARGTDAALAASELIAQLR